MMKINNWRDEEVTTSISKRGVLALQNPFDNLVKGNVSPWPPPEIIQKLYKSKHETAFLIENNLDLKMPLGFYSDLQSINSENAITWSVFGTANYFSPKKRNLFVSEFQEIAGLRFNSFNNSNISLWRRLPHPETLTSGGPEVDFLIHTESTLILGESKWKSSISTSQGINKNRDQIQLRIEFLEKYGAKFFPNIQNFAVVLLALNNESVIQYNSKNIQCVSITWDQVCSMDSHLFSEEIRNYLHWKKSHQQMYNKPNQAD